MLNHHHLGKYIIYLYPYIYSHKHPHEIEMWQIRTRVLLLHLAVEAENTLLCGIGANLHCRAQQQRKQSERDIPTMAYILTVPKRWSSLYARVFGPYVKCKSLNIKP